MITLCFPRTSSFVKLTTAFFCLMNSAMGIGTFGTFVEDAFQAEVDASRGTLIDFTGLTGQRLTNQFQGTLGVTFESNIFTNGNPTSGLPVYVSNSAGRVDTIVGTPFLSGTDDGRMGYQIVFDTPQRWAGIQRSWNEFTITEFYDIEDNLLYSLTGEATPYVGFFADTTNTDMWIKRIQLDGSESGGSRQVGYSDNIRFGTSFVAIPEPSTWILMITGLGVIGFVMRRRLASANN